MPLFNNSSRQRRHGFSRLLPPCALPFHHASGDKGRPHIARVFEKRSDMGFGLEGVLVHAEDIRERTRLFNEARSRFADRRFGEFGGIPRPFGFDADPVHHLGVRGCAGSSNRFAHLFKFSLCQLVQGQRRIDDGGMPGSRLERLMRARYRGLLRSCRRRLRDLPATGFQMFEEPEQRRPIPRIERAGFIPEIGKLDVEIARRPQYAAEPSQVVLERSHPISSQQRASGMEEGAQLPGGHPHLMQAFRFPSEPRPGIMRRQPSHVAGQRPGDMLDDRSIRRRRGIEFHCRERQRPEQFGPAVMIARSGSTQLSFEVGKRGVFSVDPFDFKFPEALTHLRRD